MNEQTGGVWLPRRVCTSCGRTVNERDWVPSLRQYRCIAHCPLLEQQIRIRVYGERMPEFTTTTTVRDVLPSYYFGTAEVLITECGHRHIRPKGQVRKGDAMECPLCADLQTPDPVADTEAHHASEV